MWVISKGQKNYQNVTFQTQNMNTIKLGVCDVYSFLAT